MSPDDELYLTHEYRQLPVVVQSHVTPKEFAWLDNEQRHRLLEDFTEPEGGFVDG